MISHSRQTYGGFLRQARIRAYIDANEKALSKTDNEVAKITICAVRSVQFPNVAISSTAENIFDYSRNNKRTRELKC